MGKFWLMGRHEGDGPSVLIEANGSMKVISVLRFGPEVVELEEQQEIWDSVSGCLVPTLKPFMPAAHVHEDGVAVHADLSHDGGPPGSSNRVGRRASGPRGSGVGQGGGPSRSGSRGRG